MKVKELVKLFDLEVVAGETGLGNDIQNGYCGDLLSDVMANASEGCVWMTVQGHLNIIAVAVLIKMAAIIICGGHSADEITLKKADEENIPILLWPNSAYDLAGRLYANGVGQPDTQPA
jgi:predicted transcriptional regulator